MPEVSPSPAVPPADLPMPIAVSAPPDLRRDPDKAVTSRARTPALFDYGVLDPEKAAAARIAAVRIRGRMQLAAESIIEVGKELTEQKKALGHGNFTSWFESEFGKSPDTAQLYMRVYDAYGEKTERVRLLPLRALALLTSPSTPQEVRDKVEQRIEAGETITAQEIKELRDKLKTEKAKLKAEKERRKEQEDRANANVTLSEITLRQLGTAENTINSLRGQVLDLQGQLLDAQGASFGQQSDEPDEQAPTDTNTPIDAHYVELLPAPAPPVPTPNEPRTALIAKFVDLYTNFTDEEKRGALTKIKARRNSCSGGELEQSASDDSASRVAVFTRAHDALKPEDKAAAYLMAGLCELSKLEAAEAEIASLKADLQRVTALPSPSLASAPIAGRT